MRKYPPSGVPFLRSLRHLSDHPGVKLIGVCGEEGQGRFSDICVDGKYKLLYTSRPCQSSRVGFFDFDFCSC